MDVSEQIKNYSDAVDKLSVGYNKSVTISSVTMNSLHILDNAMNSVRNELQNIVSAFEEMQAASKSTASHTDNID